MDNLLIDFYELTMSQAYFDQNKHEQLSCFDLFFRKCPDKGSFVIANGVQDCIKHILNFGFTAEDISYLKSLNRFSNDFLDYLKDVKFTGDVYAVPDGTVVFPNEPVITVVAPLIQAQLIETALLLLFNHASLITTKTSRMVRAAKGGSIMEFGTRRAQGYDAANKGAVDAYIAGAVGTACTVTGKEYGIPVIGTVAHSFIQSFDSEYDAFVAYAKSFPNNTSLLVDTYDVLHSGVPNAIRVAKEVLEPMGKRLAGIRLDSGDLAYLSKEARKMLDEAGLTDTKICASNSLDEYTIENLLRQGARIDQWGVGERLITAMSQPILGGVYKLTAVEENGYFVPRIKISENAEKITNPGFKDIVRLYDKGKIITDVITLFGEKLPTDSYTLVDPNNPWKTKEVKGFIARRIREKMIEKGELSYELKSVEARRQNVQRELDSLWEENLRLDNPQTFIVSLSEKLRRTKNQLLEAHKNSVKSSTEADFDESLLQEINF